MMYKVRDFILKEVFTEEGKKLGEVTDVIIDFHLGEILGFKLSSFSLRKKSYYILKDDLIVIAERIVAKEKKQGNYLEFRNIKNMEVISNIMGLIGVAEELLIDENFNIKALVVTSGFLNSIFYGKKILLMKNLILGEKTILFNDTDKMALTSKIHSTKEGDL